MSLAHEEDVAAGEGVSETTHFSLGSHCMHTVSSGWAACCGLAERGCLRRDCRHAARSELVVADFHEPPLRALLHMTQKAIWAARREVVEEFVDELAPSVGAPPPTPEDRCMALADRLRRRIVDLREKLKAHDERREGLVAWLRRTERRLAALCPDPGE